MSKKFPTIRLSEFLKRLEKFGVRSRSGKGSNCVLYKGRTLKVVGRHKPNREIPDEMQKSILRKFGISREEWLGEEKAKIDEAIKEIVKTRKEEKERDPKETLH